MAHSYDSDGESGQWIANAEESHCLDADLLDMVRKQKARERKNKARREKHAALLSLGLVRVKGALGGVYYE